MHNDVRRRNRSARDQLAKLIAALAPVDLDRALGGGWTAKAALANLAFWDRFVTATLAAWRETAVMPSAIDSGAANEAGLRDWLEAAPEYVLAEVLRAASEADRAVEALGGETFEAIARAREAGSTTAAPTAWSTSSKFAKVSNSTAQDNSVGPAQCTGRLTAD